MYNKDILKHSFSSLFLKNNNTKLSEIPTEKKILPARAAPHIVAWSGSWLQLADRFEPFSHNAKNIVRPATDMA